MDPTVVSERRPDLDWIRVGAFALLILYHVGMFYVPWDWHVKSPRQAPWLEPLMELVNPWRLDLLFLVSGAATRFMADKLTPGALAQARTMRLLPPLLLAMFVIVPPQSYLEIAEQAPRLLGSAGDFYLKYVTASGHWCDADGCLITPTWNHMWFVAYLLVYTLVLVIILMSSPRLGERLSGLFEQALQGGGLLVWPIMWLGLLRLVLGPRFPFTHALIDDWCNHALSFSAFLFGFGFAKSRPLAEAFTRLRRAGVALWLVSYAAFAAYAWAFREVPAPLALRAPMQVVYAAQVWGAIAAILGYGRLHLARGGPVLDYLTQGVFPFYIVHQTIIIVVAHNLALLRLPIVVEVAILLGATVAGCFATYELVRRVDGLRPLFGLKPLSAGRATVRGAG